MQVIGVIGGSGFYEFPELKNVREINQSSEYGEVCGILSGELEGKKIIFLPRHGNKHSIPPHCINYRANIAAMEALGVTDIFGFNAVGGILSKYSPGSLVIPNQIIDYTYGREHTYYDASTDTIDHVDFTKPFDTNLEKAVLKCFHHNENESQLECFSGATYGCMQGPRLETAAEIKKLKKDGCDIVGMTLMPEASLAREKKINYISLCIVVNWAAGIGEENISLNSIMMLLNSSVPEIREIFRKTLTFL